MTPPHRASLLAALLVATLAGALLAAPAAAGAAGETPWRMEGCVGLATLALAPLASLQAALPAGYKAQDAATFLLPGTVDTTALLGEPAPGQQGLLGVEVWKCNRVSLGNASAAPATFGSIAVVLDQPAGSPEATLYFYKLENWFSAQSLVSQSTRLGAPTKLVTASTVQETAVQATGSVTLATGETYTLTAQKAGALDPGNFREWHKGAKGTSQWHAAFTSAPGHQGTGTLTVPAGSAGARLLGSASGQGLGITSHSTFTGGASLA